jgi:hypothetical protein
MAVAFAGCGGTSEETCREPGERYPDRPVAIAVALERDGQLTSVHGSLIARRGRPVLLCTGLTAARPPSCRRPSLRIAGLRDTTAFEQGESKGVTTWWRNVTMAGRIDGDTVRYELTCRARDVQRHIGDATGVQPTFNAFGSNAEVERLDYGPLPERIPRGLRERYGYFVIGVATDDAERPIYESEAGGKPDSRGIYWTKAGGSWLAVKHYGNEVAVAWTAGARRELDERWRRLDRIMRALD